MPIRKYILPGMLMLGLCNPLYAAEQARPRIGLVLGGGGARGAAHIGVLKVLEENRIPVDAVAGTSVGAIIGGMYASGMPVSEIEREILAIDWKEVFTDDTARPDLSFRRKEDDYDFLIKFDVGITRNGLATPKGLIQGQKIMAFLRRVTLPVYNIRDFDHLPTPFRALATDLVTGRPVALGSGDLAGAMRASMAVPGIFEPVKLDGHLLVDGGLNGNLPIQVMRDMDVDIIIAVDVGFPLQSTQGFGTALDVTNQTLNILINNETARGKALLKKNVDVLLELSLEGIDSSDFLQVGEAVEMGYRSASAQTSKFKALALPEAEYQRYLTHRGVRQRGSPVIRRVNIEKDSVVSDEYIRAVVGTEIGRPLNSAQLTQDVSRIYGLGLFESVDARLIEDEGDAILNINTRRKSWGPHYLNLGLGLQNDFEGGSDFEVSTRYTRTEINSLAAEWRVDAQVGADSGIATEFYQPLSPGSPFFLAPHIGFNQQQLDIFDGGARIAELRIGEGAAGLDAGRELGNWGELRLGLRRGEGYSRLRIGDVSDPALQDSDYEIGQYSLRFAYDRLDNVRFPREGVRWLVRGQFSRDSFGADDEYDLYQLDYLKAATFGRHTFLGILDAGTKRHDEDSGLQDVFRLGGFLNLSGLQEGQLTGNHFALGGLVYYYQITPENSLFSMPIYLGSSLELGNTWQNTSEIGIDSAIAAASVMVGMDTLLGPLYIAFGSTEDSDQALYFFLGQGF
ncbi:MAG TPA: patatin-like phospholipase family protein [Gammaproteobacteria bacterium]|nr:patatin-like phospholipase family protein [Gammaproteobacteria bacterium]